MSADRPVGLLVSDVDSTFLTQEVIELVAARAGTVEQVADVTARAMAGELDFEESLRERVATLAGLPASVVADVRAELAPSRGALALVRRAKRAGWIVALVSGGFHEIIDPLAAEAGVDHVLANRFEIAGGRLTGRTSGPVIGRGAKEDALREYARRYRIPLNRTVAIGDGANDIAMIRAAALGIGFSPKQALRDAADLSIDSGDLMDAWPHLEALAAR